MWFSSTCSVLRTKVFVGTKCSRAFEEKCKPQREDQEHKNILILSSLYNICDHTGSLQNRSTCVYLEKRFNFSVNVKDTDLQRNNAKSPSIYTLIPYVSTSKTHDSTLSSVNTWTRTEKLLLRLRTKKLKRTWVGVNEGTFHPTFCCVRVKKKDIKEFGQHMLTACKM